MRDFESVFADAVYQKRQLQDQLDDVTQLIANPTASASRSDNNKNKNAKDSAIFYTVPLKGVAEILVFFVVK